MRDVKLDDLDGVSGGATLGALGIQPAAQTAPTTPGNNIYGILGGEPFGGNPFEGGGPFGGFGHHGGFHEGRAALREFMHDDAFQGALQQFEAAHPELAQALAPLNDDQGQGFGHFGGFRAVMHDPNGRAALNQLLDDPNMQNALAQYAAQNPEVAGPLQQAVTHLNFRLDHPELAPPGFGHGPFGGFGHGPFGGPPPGVFGGPFQPGGVGPQGLPLVGAGQPVGLPGGAEPISLIGGNFGSVTGTGPLIGNVNGQPITGTISVTPNGYSYSYSYGSGTAAPVAPVASPLGGGLVGAGEAPKA